MNVLKRFFELYHRLLTPAVCVLSGLLVLGAVPGAPAQEASSLPEPRVAVHVSELTQALEGGGAASAWPYFLGHRSVEEALRSDGTPFVAVSDADIAAGRLRNPDGSPRYPIVISLAAEAVADDAIAPLQEYVQAGGFLFAGSSSFTRRPDGTSRGDFALASSLGIHMASPKLSNWYKNARFTKIGDHRLTSHIPQGTLDWSGPLSPEEIPWGLSPDHPLHDRHLAWQVTAADATVLATGNEGPLLTVKNYGKGQFLYHGAAQPLLHDATDPGMYAYVIFRRAIEWAFGSFGLPLVKVSPWPYQYDAAFTARHDFENNPALIESIEASAEFEHSLGVKGDYYFSTGALREDLGGDAGIVASLRRAVAASGATIGSHNGGLRNPVNDALSAGDYDLWHWGPDEALDAERPGYADGKAYALASILASFEDIEGWLTGLDNGRPLCGGAGTCPRTWISPYGNAAREGSRDILDRAGVLTAGEQKLSPFPQATLSLTSPTVSHAPVTLPLSDWYVGSDLAQAIDTADGREYHTRGSIRAAVDFYYDLGGLINFYAHSPSNNGRVAQEYVTYSMTKPRLWATNAVAVADWWRSRSTIVAIPEAAAAGDFRVAATLSGATDPEAAIEVVLPPGVQNIIVTFDDRTADASEYRATAYGLKVRVGTSVSRLVVQYTVQTAPPAAQDDSYGTAAGTALSVAAPGVLGNDSDPAGRSLTAKLVSGPSHGAVTLNADGSFTYAPAAAYAGSDSFTYAASNGLADSSPATVTLLITAPTPTNTVQFTDDFTRSSLSPWSVAAGTWTIANGVLQGSSAPSTYAIAWYGASWSNYSVEAQVQLPAGAFGGGIGGRVNAATGARYTAAIYPDGSAGGSNVLKLVKFRDWTTWNYAPMAQVSLPSVGTGPHTLRMTFAGSRVQVSYDGQMVIDVTDAGYDSRPAYAAGGISLDMWTYTTPYAMKIDNVSVSLSGGITAPPAAQDDSYGTAAGTALSVAAPGVLGNDSDPAGRSLTAKLVSGPSHGAVTLNADGSFTYAPTAAYAGSDSFTYAANNGLADSSPATVTLLITAPTPTNTVQFTDDFTRSSLSPWSVAAGTWTIANGVLQGSSAPSTYAIAWYGASWSDYSVEAQVQLPAGAFGGGIGGRVNAATGARYTAAIYPDGSAGGSNVLKLVKFRDWTTWNYAPMAQVSLPSVGTGPHTLRMTFAGSRIQISYDGQTVIDVTDAGFDSRPAYGSGGISTDLWTYTTPYAMKIDNVTVESNP